MGSGGRAIRSGRATALAWVLAFSVVATAGSITTSAGAATPDATSALDVQTTRLGPTPVRGDLGMPEPFHLAPNPTGATFADRWREVSVGIAADRAVLAACRLAPDGCPDEARRFLAVVTQAQAETGRARLGVLNRAINLAITYTSDLVQHGHDDVWSAPLATFASGMGDCEDYAIAKYVALLEAGTSPDDLRIVIVDERWSGLHAVASVRLGGAWLVLDNRRMALIEDRDLGRYRAVATFDERGGKPASLLAEAGAGSSGAQPAIGSALVEPSS